MASYPSSVKSFTTRTDGPSSTIAASHMNDVQDEIAAIEGGLLNGLTHVVKAPDGTVAAPGLTFTNEPDCGVYKEGTNAIALATAGAKALGIDSTQFIDSPTQPRCSAYANATQSLTSGAETAIALAAEDFDVGTMHDNASNNTRITIPAGGDGLYLVTGQGSIAPDATGIRLAIIRKNGTTEMARTSVGQPGAGAQCVMPIPPTLIALAATDYVELMLRQDSGGALNANSVTRAISSILQVVKLW